MPYDFDEATNDAPTPTGPPVSMDPRDLEAIVILLESAAIALSPNRDSKFTFDELFREACDHAGPEFGLRESDAKIVARYAKFLKKEIGGKLSFR